MNAAAASLQGRRVLVTRPAAQADPLVRLLQAHGAEVRRLPLLAIEPVRQPAAAARQLREARSARAWIFTSVNAVEFAAQLDPGPWPQVIAVGAATAVALETLGHQPLQPEQHYSSEGVLALAALQDVTGQRLLIVTGENARALMAETLRERGAHVQMVAVYRRVPLPHVATQVQQQLRGCDAVLLSSGEALQQLLALCDAPARRLLDRTRLVVPSQRVVEQARSLGCSGPLLVPRQVSDAAYLDCLEQALAPAGLPPKPIA